MTVSVVIPFESDDPRRIANLSIVQAFYAAEFPDWEIVVSGNDPLLEGSFHARSRNLGAFLAQGRLLVFNDADSLCPAAHIQEAVTLASDSPGLVLAYTDYCRLSEAETRMVTPGSYEYAFDAPIDWAMWGGSSMSSGCLAIRRRCFEDVKCFDASWLHGFEDYDFAQRCAQRWPLRRIAGKLTHLWHPRPDIEPEVFDRGRYQETWPLGLPSWHQVEVGVI